MGRQGEKRPEGLLGPSMSCSHRAAETHLQVNELAYHTAGETTATGRLGGAAKDLKGLGWC